MGSGPPVPPSGPAHENIYLSPPVAVLSKVVILVMFIHCLLLLQSVCRFFVGCWFSAVALSILHITEEDRAGCITSAEFLQSFGCLCYVSLHRGVMYVIVTSLSTIRTTPKGILKFVYAIYLFL